MLDLQGHVALKAIVARRVLVGLRVPKEMPVSVAPRDPKAIPVFAALKAPKAIPVFAAPKAFVAQAAPRDSVGRRAFVVQKVFAVLKVLVVQLGSVALLVPVAIKALVAQRDFVGLPVPPAIKALVAPAG